MGKTTRIELCIYMPNIIVIAGVWLGGSALFKIRSMSYMEGVLDISAFRDFEVSCCTWAKSELLSRFC
jgi:hypothetical protein